MSPENAGQSTEIATPTGADARFIQAEQSSEVVEPEETGQDEPEVVAQEEELDEQTSEVPDQPEEGNWDGRQESIPDEYRPYLDKKIKDLEKGFHAKMQGLSEKERAAEEARAHYESLTTKPVPASPEIDKGPPELPTGDDVTMEEFQAASDKRTQYFLDKQIEELKSSGQIVTREEYAPIQQEHETNKLLGTIASWEGYTDEVGQRMADLVQEDPSLLPLGKSEQGNKIIFNLAQRDIEIEKLRNQGKEENVEKAEQAAQVIREKAKAGERSVDRPSTTTGAAPREPSIREGFGTGDQAFLEAEQSSL